MQVRKRKRLLNQRMIVEAAVELLNERGLENLSLRQLADRLNVSAPSIYRHFADKAALKSAILDTMFFETLNSIPRPTDAAAWMQDFGEAMWRMMMQVHDYARLLLVTDIQPEHVARIIATVAPEHAASLRVLNKAGFRLEETRLDDDGSRTDVLVWRRDGST